MSLTLILKKFLFKPPVSKRIAKMLARVHYCSYSYLGPFAAAAEGGLHPKHRLTKYHRFFIDNVSEGKTVLDIGCGNGALLKDIARKTHASAVGIEISKTNVECAKAALSSMPNAEIIHSDIWDYGAKRQFNIIILSNVLEHLDKRAALLKHICNRFNPEQFLIRVPMYDREWIVPYKREMGIEWRLDTTHKIEYTENEFYREMSEADLRVDKVIFRWGEIWAVAIPRNTDK